MTLLRALLSSVAAALVTGCSGFDVLNALVPASSAGRTLDVPYGTGARQRLDVYTPRGLAKPARVVVFIYGGHWRDGEKWDYRFVAKSLASRGFVVVLPDYRVYPDATFPAFVEDAASVVRWTHDHVARLGGDPNAIFVMGHSAGAHVAALVSLDARYVERLGLPRDVIKGFAGLCGAYDFEPSPADRFVFALEPGDPAKPPEIEPITFARPDAPPTLLIHGALDRTVDPQNSIALAARLREVGARVRHIVYPKRAHADVAVSLALSFQWLAPTLDDVTRFFREQAR